jgi:hypothetical protein
MFNALQREVGSRFLDISMHLDSTCQPEPTTFAAITKGLAFISIYAAYEYTVKSIIQTVIRQMKVVAMPLNSVRLGLLPLVLDAEINAVKDAGRKTAWEKRIELFSRINSNDVVGTSDSVFPQDGSHFRLQQLHTIWKILGITEPVMPDMRLTPLIGEVVEHRNAISHGRKTATDVGRSYSKQDVMKKVNNMRDICLYLISVVESHCAENANLCR